MIRRLAFLCVAATCFLSAPLFAQITAEEREMLEKSGWITGSLLLETKPEAAAQDGAEDSEPAEIPQATERTEEEAELVEPIPEMPEPEFPVDFRNRPESYLIDSQALLANGDKRDRLKFLDYHAGDAAVDLYVYLFEAGQNLPEPEKCAAELDEAFREGKPAIILVYFMGEPERALIRLSPGLAGNIAPRECKRALESAMLQALEKEERPDQLEAFLVQMSIRIYWLERMLVGESATNEDTPYQAVTTPKPGSAILAKARPWIDASLPNLTWIGLGLSGLVSTLLAMSWWIRNRRFRFPELEIEPRLGGAHGAGIGSVISFNNSKIPPMAQRNQIPDYLPR